VRSVAERDRKSRPGVTSHLTVNEVTAALLIEHPEWSVSRCQRVARAMTRNSPGVTSIQIDNQFGRPLTYYDPTGEEATWRVLRDTAR